METSSFFKRETGNASSDTLGHSVGLVKPFFPTQLTAPGSVRMPTMFPK